MKKKADAARPMVMAAFTLSWDARILDRGQAEKSVELSPKNFRELLTGGELDEVHIAWRPCIAGGNRLEPITGLDPEFLPQGVALDLIKIERRKDEFLARYRVRRGR